MKILIFSMIAMAFVLLIPIAVFAQEGSRNMMEEYCLKNLQDDPQCKNYTSKTSEENNVDSAPSEIKENKSINPFEEFIQFIIQIFQGINPEETVKDVTKELSLDSVQNKVETAIDDISDSIPIDMSSISGNSKNKLEDCSKYKKGIRDGTDMGEAYDAMQKTKACEQRNQQLMMKQPTAATVTSQPVDNVELDNRGLGLVGTFSIRNIQVTEKPNYNVISLNLYVQGKNMGLDDSVLLSPVFLTLKNQNGKSYHFKPYECNSPPMAYSISGKGGTEMTFTHCYSVEKEMKNFDVYFFSDKSYHVGSFVLN